MNQNYRFEYHILDETATGMLAHTNRAWFVISMCVGLSLDLLLSENLVRLDD